MILSPCDSNGPEIGELLDLGIPIVAFDRPVNDLRADAVLADNFEASRMAVEHLLGGGRRRIGYLGISTRSRPVPAGWPVTGPHWPTPAWNRIGKMAACG